MYPVTFVFHLAFLLHILGVLLFISGIVVAGVAFESARRREQPVEVATLLGLSRIGVLLVAAGTVLAGSFGLWLVHLGGWHYSAFWISCSIVLFVLALALGGIGGQRPKRARRMAAQLAAEHAPINAELRALLDDRAARWQNYASLLLVLAIVVLMCFRP